MRCLVQTHKIRYTRVSEIKAKLRLLRRRSLWHCRSVQYSVFAWSPGFSKHPSLYSCGVRLRLLVRPRSAPNKHAPKIPFTKKRVQYNSIVTSSVILLFRIPSAPWERTWASRVSSATGPYHLRETQHLVASITLTAQGSSNCYFRELRALHVHEPTQQRSWLRCDTQLQPAGVNDGAVIALLYPCSGKVVWTFEPCFHCVFVT